MNQRVAPLFLSAPGMVCALGASRKQIRDKLFAGSRSGLVARTDLLPGRTVFVGAVGAELPAIDDLPQHFHSRNNQLLLAALAQMRDVVDVALQQYGATRIAVVLGSSTSGISDGEAALQTVKQDAAQALPSSYAYAQQEMGNPSQCLAHVLGLDNVAFTISTACSSSGKALASAARLLRAGLCDAVLCGGVDSLCKMTVQGFAALESVAEIFCNPFMQARDGINIGEAAALFLMTRDNLCGDVDPVCLLGAGEASDAFHMSAPDPQGVGAELAIRAALSQAGLEPTDIDYINLHGTGTRKNDEMEAHLVARIFGESMPCSATKGMTGHTLGAAGALEAGLCWLVLSQADACGKMPPHVAQGIYDAALPPLQLCSTEPVVQKSGASKPVAVMSNSFAFGGSNVSLILGCTA